MSAFTILLVIALLCFFFAGVWQAAWPSPVQLGWLGCFFAALAFFIGGRG